MGSAIHTAGRSLSQIRVEREETTQLHSKSKMLLSGSMVTSFLSLDITIEGKLKDR